MRTLPKVEGYLGTPYHCVATQTLSRNSKLYLNIPYFVQLSILSNVCQFPVHHLELGQSLYTRSRACQESVQKMYSQKISGDEKHYTWTHSGHALDFYLCSVYALSNFCPVMKSTLPNIKFFRDKIWTVQVRLCWVRLR